MKLNHLNLSIADIPSAVTFFETFLGFRCQEVKGANTLAILENEAAFVLVLSNFKTLDESIYPTDFHIGFTLDSVDQVDDLYYRLVEAGIEIEHAPRKMRGSHVFYFRPPELVLIEIGCPA